MPLSVELVSPERTLFSGEATMVRARTVGGAVSYTHLTLPTILRV